MNLNLNLVLENFEFLIFSYLEAYTQNTTTESLAIYYSSLIAKSRKHLSVSPLVDRNPRLRKKYMSMFYQIPLLDNGRHCSKTRISLSPFHRPRHVNTCKLRLPGIIRFCRPLQSLVDPAEIVTACFPKPR